VFPGCTFFTDSPIRTNPNFSYLDAALNATGLNATLASLTAPVTVFAPTNMAIMDYAEFMNITITQLLASPQLSTILSYHVTPEIFTNETTFMDAQEIPTLAGPGNNLTIATGNGTLMGTNVPSISVISYGSEALIQPGSGQACNIIYYPIDAVLVPMSALDLTSPDFTAYLEDLLVPGGSETPAGLVIDAVNRRQTAKVATAFEEAQAAGFSSQVLALCDATAISTGGTSALLQVLNQIAIDAGCPATDACVAGVNQGLQTATAITAFRSAAQNNYPELSSCLQSQPQTQ
jgi:uncharacterized surface protein with fasciclin (FAS1) repeats